ASRLAIVPSGTASSVATSRRVRSSMSQSTSTSAYFCGKRSSSESRIGRKSSIMGSGLASRGTTPLSLTRRRAARRYASRAVGNAVQTVAGQLRNQANHGILRHRHIFPGDSFLPPFTYIWMEARALFQIIVGSTHFRAHPPRETAHSCPNHLTHLVICYDGCE